MKYICHIVSIKWVSCFAINQFIGQLFIHQTNISLTFLNIFVCCVDLSKFRLICATVENFSNYLVTNERFLAVLIIVWSVTGVQLGVFCLEFPDLQCRGFKVKCICEIHEHESIVQPFFKDFTINYVISRCAYSFASAFMEVFRCIVFCVGVNGNKNHSYYTKNHPCSCYTESILTGPSKMIKPT